MEELPEIQYRLARLSENDIDDTVSYLISFSLSKIENLSIIARQIIKFSAIRVNSCDIYIKLISKLEEDDSIKDRMKQELEKYIINRFTYHYMDKFLLSLVRIYIQQSIISFEPIKTFLEKIDYQDFHIIYPYYILFLYEFFPESEQYRYKHIFMQYQTKYQNLQDFPLNIDIDNFKPSTCISGDQEDSLYMSIKNDDFELFSSYTTLPNFTVNDHIDYKPLDPYFPYITDPTSINAAAFFGSKTIFKFLISNNADITQFTAMNAVASGNTEIIRICFQHKLLDFKCIPYSLKFYRHDIYHWLLDMPNIKIPMSNLIKTVAPYGDAYILKELIEEFNVPAINVYKIFILMGDYDLVRFYLNYNPNINEMEMKEYAFLFSANDGEMIDLLLSIPGINVNVVNYDKETFLHKLVEANNYKYLQKFLDMGVIDCNAQTRAGETPLHWAAHKNDLISIQILLNHEKVDPNITAKNMRTAYDISLINKTPEILELYKKCPRMEFN
ncbi:hypothetical protein TVAG_035020 [Trichomonas vaginalis G3]|uniref:DUF3447 domain-containing protein n=1 Tax=Trichomonas vaginalis (strain ATCC PRA-98 / G3) TaxID=412133 RepID=A2DAH6_TRIV3|nr:Ankyrin repeat family [Trichomonas vaginalis G3]EAY22479.1 hypothetical protein TVAG_035020 [Trichomonas vaginalis G3]KAI5497204.1 Ankyrin repeat family [Trichomonas vaginalis G3]|eukprot:XP_001583465.1 hypothetical protein [Trichomonas vaginalis G3]